MNDMPQYAGKEIFQRTELLLGGGDGFYVLDKMNEAGLHSKTIIISAFSREKTPPRGKKSAPRAILGIAGARDPLYH